MVLISHLFQECLSVWGDLANFPSLGDMTLRWFEVCYGGCQYPGRRYVSIVSGIMLFQRWWRLNNIPTLYQPPVPSGICLKWILRTIVQYSQTLRYSKILTFDKFLVWIHLKFLVRACLGSKFCLYLGYWRISQIRWKGPSSLFACTDLVSFYLLRESLQWPLN